MASFKQKQLWARFIYIAYCLLSLLLHAPIVNYNYALGEGVVVMYSLHTYVAYQCAPFCSDRVHKMQ